MASSGEIDTIVAARENCENLPDYAWRILPEVTAYAILEPDTAPEDRKILEKVVLISK
jgi:hypothetical protein